ncbi:MAG: TVP38/TMEM64 family protein [Clostridia bacterium]|nr:TVP38/TMEM64 family protein [Clostridia bacterium]
MKNKKISPQLILNITALVIIIGVAAFFTVRYWDTFKVLGTEEGLEDFVESIRGTGIFGALILILIQALQVTVAFIPGEFVELAAGVMFGPWLGLLICLIGLNLGTVIIFGFVRYFGKAFVHQNVNERDFERLKFLNDPRRSLIIMFFIFIIPGIPKDVLIYPVPLTKVKMHHFLIMSTVARIPTVISSTFVGSAVIEENYLSAIIVFSVSVAIAIPGLIFNKQICAFIERLFPKKQSGVTSDADSTQ